MGGESDKGNAEEEEEENKERKKKEKNQLQRYVGAQGLLGNREAFDQLLNSVALRTECVRIVVLWWLWFFSLCAPVAMRIIVKCRYRVCDFDCCQFKVCSTNLIWSF